MIGYITLGVSDVSRAGELYDEIFTLLGAARIYDQDSCIAWARDKNCPIFTILTPENGQPCSYGNGTMIALEATSKDQVEALHAKALVLGASDEGKPGLRSGGYYCAYIRDFDGNKINFHFNPNA